MSWLGALLRAIDDHAGRFVAGCVALYLLVAVPLAITQPDPPEFYDEVEYLQIADSVADGDGFAIDGRATAYRPPAWPIALAPALALGATTTHLRLLNVAIGAVGIAAAAGAATNVWSRRAGVVAAAMSAGYPLAVYAATTLYPQTLAATGVAGLAWWLTRRRPTTADLMVAGTIGGLLVLTISTLFVVVAGLAAAVAWDRRSLVRHLIVVGVVGVTVVSTWTIRNAVVMDEPVILATNSGVNLLLGNSPDATATSGTDTDIAVYEAEATRRNLDEVERDHYFREEAVTWISENPGDAAALFVAKTAAWFTVKTDTATEGSSSSARDALLAMAYGVLIALTVARRWIGPAFRRWDWWLIAIYVVAAPLHAVFFTRLRFRIPFEPLLILAAAPAVVALAERWAGTITTSAAGVLGGDDDR